MTTRGRILVTGANTSIGRQLVHELYRDQQGVELVWALGSEELPYYFRDFHRERFTYRVVNLTKPRQLRELFLSEPFRRAAVDTVVHLDFLPKATHDKAAIEQVVEGTRQFLNHCLATQSMTKFIFNSGSLVYKLRPWTSCCIEEDSELNFDTSADAWTRARVDADMLCRAKMDNGRLKIVVLRPSPIIGRNVSSHLNGFFDSYLLTTIAGFDPMLRPVHSDDVRKAIKLAIRADVQGVFNVAGRDVAPLSEFCRLSGRPVVEAPFAVVRRLNGVQRALGLTDCNLDTEPSWLKFSCILDTRKIEKKMGFEPEMHIKFG